MMKALLDATSRAALSALIPSIVRFAGRAGAKPPVGIHEEPSISLSFETSQNDTASDSLELQDAAAQAANKLAFGKSDGRQADTECMSRLFSLTEKIRLSETKAPSSPCCSLPLDELTPANIFAKRSSNALSDNMAKAQYAKLWKRFSGLLNGSEPNSLPREHCRQWPLWLDDLDSLWMTFAANMPSSSESHSGVSLYDRSKTAAGLAAAIWRWHYELGKDSPADHEKLRKAENLDEEMFLLIQGDFHGIQDFIFAGGSKTQKAGAKILRGRSFYVSLITELAALKVLDTLCLPSTSQIINAAGKFLIIAPNTPKTLEKLCQVQKELDHWFITNTLAVSGIGIAAVAASGRDLAADAPASSYAELSRKLYETLEKKKLQRLGLCSLTDPVLRTDYSQGVSDYDRRLPKTSGIPEDQILVGEQLVRKNRILVFSEKTELPPDREGIFRTLGVTIFGYRVVFCDRDAAAVQFGGAARSGALLRCWDFSLPASETASLWQGSARRFINGYIARFKSLDELKFPKYSGVNASDISPTTLVKTFDTLACEDRIEKEGGKAIGLSALAALKGDIDNLGLIFQKGLGAQNSFAATASLSRQINLFFAAYLPVFCAEKFPNTYTVFAGGDDFFLIGPWHSIQKLARAMCTKFNEFSCNQEVHFSCGLAFFKPGIPLRRISEMAEENLSDAKAAGKNRASLFGQIIEWQQWDELEACERTLEDADKGFGLSSSYVYSLIGLCAMAADEANPEASLWRSRFYYQTSRLAERASASAASFIKTDLAASLGTAIEKQKGALRIPLTNYFYARRD